MYICMSHPNIHCHWTWVVQSGAKTRAIIKTHKVTVLFLDDLFWVWVQFLLQWGSNDRTSKFAKEGVRNRVVVVCGRLRESSEGLRKKLLSGSPFKNRNMFQNEVPWNGLVLQRSISRIVLRIQCGSSFWDTPNLGSWKILKRDTAWRLVVWMRKPA